MTGGYKHLFKQGITELACMAHARRKFFDLHAANQHPVAEEALHAALGGEIEIPMEYFSRAVEVVLLDGLLHDAVDFTLTEKHWNQVVQNCGYVASEQAVERNSRGVNH